MNFDEIKLQLDTSKLNQQNEINNANRVASNYLQNYLKQQGIANSGVGMNAYANLQNNANNNLADVNANYNSDLYNAKQQYQQDYQNNLEKNMALFTSGSQYQDLINKVNNDVANDSGLQGYDANNFTDYIKNYQNYALGNEANSNAIATLENISSNLQNMDRYDENYATLQAMSTALNQAYKNGDTDTINKLVQQYEDLVNDSMYDYSSNVWGNTYDEEGNVVANDDTSKLEKLGVAYGTTPVSSKSILTYLQDNTNMNGINNANDDQYKYLDQISGMSKEELDKVFKNGVAYDVNIGKGTTMYVYYNGNWYASSNTKKNGALTIKEAFENDKTKGYLNNSSDKTSSSEETTIANNGVSVGGENATNLYNKWADLITQKNATSLSITPNQKKAKEEITKAYQNGEITDTEYLNIKDSFNTLTGRKWWK